MPPPPRPDPPPNVLRVSCNGLYGTLPWANVFWVRNGGGSTPATADLNTFLSSFATKYNARFMPLVNTAVSLPTVVGLYYGASGPALVASVTTPHVGQRAGAGQASSIAAVISWRVSTPYRGGHPRTYLCGINDADRVSVNHWTSAYQTSVAAAANGFLADINALTQGALTDLHLGTVSFVHARAWRTPPVFRDYTPAASTCDQRVDTQRRRLGPDA